ncbi:hypothetical protein [Nocardioides jiangxiensis]|uniref:DUF4439 domain-containing protein n=1 Tax=Nocardioides jiangxiensis TaxID=3064524 RepID=A0ABT9B1W9_9ACTN|nr:hypothetical protein [Nocardioides sp. WY-20]MDO7868849.1 hypothetical protein [Nocardioides sp. WY-20]
MKRGRQDLILVVLIVAFLGFAAAGETRLVGWWGGRTLEQRMADHPQPPLYPATTVARAGHLIDPEAARAHALMARFWQQSRTAKPHDDKFMTWAASAFPVTPDADAAQPAATATSHAGNVAAAWLHNHGTYDVWMLAADKHAGTVHPADLKDATATAISLATQLSDTLRDQLRTQSTTVPTPTPTPTTGRTTGEAAADGPHVPPFPFPAREEAAAAAARGVLAALDTGDSATYVDLERQVAWSRLYTRTLSPADIGMGALLGDMVAEYVLATRGGLTPDQMG